jgi:hypothetical protein
MPGGYQRLVMVDENNRFGWFAQHMKFRQSRWLGVWVKPDDLKFSFPANWQKSFPNAAVRDMTDEEIRENIAKRVLSRQNQRLSQMPENQRRMSWHPSRSAINTAITDVANRISGAVREDSASAASAAPVPTPPALQAAPVSQSAPEVGQSAAELQRVAEEEPAIPGANLTGDIPAALEEQSARLPRRTRKAKGTREPAIGIDAPQADLLPLETAAPAEAIVADASVAEIVGGNDEQRLEAADPALIPDDADIEESISPLAAIRQTMLLGLNHLGQEVFESGDGVRFVKVDDQVVARESDDLTPEPTFLRQNSPKDLDLCASGLVNEVSTGKTLRSEDFLRYVQAIFGEGKEEDRATVELFQEALDSAFVRHMAANYGTDRDSYQAALKLHEGRPSYWRAPGSIPTPLPLALAMQSIAAAKMMEIPGAEAIDLTSKVSAHSWALGKVSSIVGTDYPEHDVTIGGVFSHPIPPRVIGTLKVSRGDHEAILTSMAKRKADGLSAFLIAGGEKPGQLDAEFKRVLQYVGSQYEVLGLVDLDPKMIATGNETPSRLVVFGKRREEIDYAFAVPPAAPVIYDYENLWQWTETLRASSFGQEMTFGDDGRDENRWQAPYIPASQISEPIAMSPRNMLGPVRQSLSRIVARHGVGIDEFVSEKLHWSFDELAAYLDSEQIDAVAIGIEAMDTNQAMVEADATGLGKGRLLAAMMRYAVLQGRKVVFITEKADLFPDIYRDIIDIGSLDLFQDPFIMNNDLVVKTDLGITVGRSPSREEMLDVILSGKVSEKSNITLATYSQFSHAQEPFLFGNTVSARKVLKDMLAGERVDRHTAIMESYKLFGIATPMHATNDENLASAKGNLAIALKDPKKNQGDIATLNREIHLRTCDDAVLIDELQKLMPRNTMGLKATWAQTAMRDTFFVTDESHNAAGPDSATNQNLAAAVASAASVAYSSATFAKDTKNFSFYQRIFPESVNVMSVASTLDRGGAGLQEILSTMLAGDGRMIRREHDLSNIQFKMSIDDTRIARNEEWANAVAGVLSIMAVISGEMREIATEMDDNAKKEIELTVRDAKSDKDIRIKATNVVYTHIGSKCYNLSRALMLAINADQSADHAIAALEAGRKPVLAVENTMETVLKELDANLENAPVFYMDSSGHFVDPERAAVDTTTALEQMFGISLSTPAEPVDPLEGNAGGPADPLGSTKSSSKPRLIEVRDLGRRVGFKDLLRRYADTIRFGIAQGEYKQGRKTTTGSVRIDLATGAMEPAFRRMYELIDNLPEIPASPLDAVRKRITDAGYIVEEISGRKIQLIELPNGNHGIGRLPTRSKQAIKKNFNGGHTDALILSKSGAAGISLHASKTFVNQSQREMIEWQAAADISTRIQIWGRVNRKGQTCNPIMRMMSSGLPGETRLLIMQNAHLRKLSANISGNADNAAIDFNAPDILNSIGNEVCFRWIENNPVLADRLGIDARDLENQHVVTRGYSGTAWVDRVTGRIPMLDVPSQRQVYKDITAEFSALLEQYELEGRSPLQAGIFDVRARKVSSKVIELPPLAGDSLFAAPVSATEIAYDVKLEAMDVAALEQEIKNANLRLMAEWGTEEGSYKSNLQDAILARWEELAPTLKREEFATVDEALAHDKPSALKSAMYRAQSLDGYVQDFAPGIFLKFYDPETGGKETEYNTRWSSSLILDMQVPQRTEVDDLCKLSMYKIKVISEIDRTPKWITLAAIHNMRSHITRDDQPARSWFMQNLATPFDKTFTRVIFEGNLFRAAEMSTQIKTGKPVSFTDQKGIWHHAILMPSGIDMDRVNRIPVEIVDGKMLKAALLHPDHISVSDWPDKRETKAFELIFYDFKTGRKGIHVNSGKKSHTWLCENEAINLHMSEPWKGDRNLRSAPVNPAKLEQFCTDFMDAAKKSGTPVFISGRYREWALDYSSQIRLQPAESVERADAMVNLVLQGDNLRALDTMGI